MSDQDVFGAVKSRSGWGIFLGLLTAALGVFLILYPVITATITTIVLGGTLTLVGLAQVALALQSRNLGQFFLRVLSGLLNGVVGIVLVVMPAPSVAALTALLGVLLIAQGVLQAVIALRVRPADRWGWVLLDAICSLVLGVLILAEWPLSSVWAIGTLVGASVLVSGITRVMISGKARGIVARVDHLAHGHA